MSDHLEKLPLHTLKSQIMVFEDIAYQNPYDFHKKHRHDYLEIILCEKGGGKQWVDFGEIDLKDYSCYIVLPKQVHLLKRNDTTKGQVVQFTYESISDNTLAGKLATISEPILFENDQNLYYETERFIGFMKSIAESKQLNYKSILAHQLNSFVCFLLNFSQAKDVASKGIHIEFMSLLEKNFKEWHTVSSYSNKLNIPENKLSLITKEHFGQTPLQLIHDRLLLEAKRMIFCETNSIKEIGYDLGFNYSTNFAQFIKKKTGFTAKQLLENSRNLN